MYLVMSALMIIVRFSCN